MSKIWIIVKSEFSRRVRSKWFIFITLLAPLLLISFIALPVVVAVLAEDEGSTRIAVVDETTSTTPARRILEAALAHVDDIYCFQLTEPSLNEIFIRVVTEQQGRDVADRAVLDVA